MHEFAIVDNIKINKIIDKLDSNKKISIIDKMKLHNYTNSGITKLKKIEISKELFSIIDKKEFKCFRGSKLANNYNYYGITIIPTSSLNIIIDDFNKLTKEDKERLNKLDISEEKWQEITKELYNLLKKAIKENKNIIHYGI